MWRLDRKDAEWVRVGRVAVERWQGRPGQLRLKARQPVVHAVGGAHEGLRSALAHLFPAPPAVSPTLLLESAWLHAVLLDTGGALWKQAQVDVLARHRFGLLYRDPQDPVSAWRLRVDHVPGHRFAMAYGLPPRLEDMLLAGAKALGFQWKAMWPASAWAREVARPGRHLAGGTGWWVCGEQDRSLILRWDRGRVVAANLAAPVCDSAASIHQRVATESVRFGVAAAHGAIAASCWTSRIEDAGVAWLQLCAPDASGGDEGFVKLSRTAA